MRVYSIGSLFAFLAVFVLLFVSFVSPWYHYNQFYKVSNEEVRNFIIEFYPTKARVITDNLTLDHYYSYKDLVQKDFYTSTIPTDFTNFIKASFSFCVLGWFVSIAMVVITLFDMYGNDKKLVKFSGKILGFVCFAFCALSFCLYLGVKPQLYKDCKTIYPDSSIYDCESYGPAQSPDAYSFWNKKFFGSSELANYGPSSGWRVVVIAAAVSLVGAVYNIFFFHI